MMFECGWPSRSMSFRRLGICRSCGPQDVCDIAEGPYERPVRQHCHVFRFPVSFRSFNRPTGKTTSGVPHGVAKGITETTQDSRVLLVLRILSFWYKRLGRSSG